MKIVKPALDDILAIRHAVLWPDKPVEFCRVAGDEAALHFGVELDQQLVCVGSVYIDDLTQSARLRKFATLPAYQGQGLGSHLLQVMLDDCRQSGLTTFWCDARETALGFYQQFGLQPEGERFYKETVPYFKMVISLNKSIIRPDAMTIKTLTPKLSMGLTTGGFEKFLKDGGGLDFRLNEKCWSTLDSGDIFEFVEEPGQNRRYCVKILKLYRAASFKELLEALPDSLFDQSQTDAYLDFFAQWWSAEDEKREGTLALYVEVVS